MNKLVEEIIKISFLNWEYFRSNPNIQKKQVSQAYFEKAQVKSIMEDCGGVPGYENVLTTLADPEHEEHEEMRVWVGENWDPEKFNADKVKFDNPYKRWVHAFLDKSPAYCHFKE